MRVKTFTAASMAKAMQLVREELGEEALILSSESGRDGVRLVAALETEDDEAEWPIDGGADDDRDAAGSPAPAPVDRRSAAADPRIGAPAAATPRGTSESAGDVLRNALAWHGVPLSLALRLQRAAAATGERDAAAALAVAFERALTFQPLGDKAGARPLMLVGPPGVGKTLTAAKLIVQAHRAGRTVVAASCDTKRAGGVEQLRAFTRILDIPLGRIEAAEALVGLAAAAADAAVVIDTAGACPFARDEMEALGKLIEAADAEPVLVLAAGCDAAEAAEIAANFAKLGCRRMIVTRLDVSRRLGAVFAAAAGGRLALAGAGISPEAADPPAAVEPLPLARLLLNNAARSPHPARPAPAADPALDQLPASRSRKAPR